MSQSITPQLRNDLMRQGQLIADFWKHAAPHKGRCSRSEVNATLATASIGDSEEQDIDRDEFLASLFQKRPGSPAFLVCALEARAELLQATAQQLPMPSVKLIWPEGKMPALLDDESEDDEHLWQSILVKFGAARSPSDSAAQHFFDVVKAGTDPNCVPFPRMQLRGRSIPRPASGRKVGVRCQDDISFPFQCVEVMDDLCTTEAENEACERMLRDRAKTPAELRKGMYSEAPFDLELTPWEMKPDGVIAADVCTEDQNKVWTKRANRGPLYAQALMNRRSTVQNASFFDEIRPKLDKEASLLEMRARWARDRADEARLFDALAEQGSKFVAWPIDGERRWPALDASWTRHAAWFKMWRSQPALPTMLKRSNSLASIDSWLSVSDISWVEIESQAGDSGWQDVLDQRTPALLALEENISLCKADICELRCMKSPPSGVLLVAEVLCVLLHAPTANNLQIFQDVCLLHKLQELRAHLPASTLDALAPYMVREDFDPEVVRKVSAACAGLCFWIRELYKFHALAHAVADRELEHKPASELLLTAKASLGTLTKASLQELKSLGKPPRGVDTVCASLLHLLAGISPNVELTKRGNVKDVSWKAFQKVAGNVDRLMEDCATFSDAIDAGKVPRRNIERARKLKYDLGPASGDFVRQKSAAAAVLFKWVCNIIAYYDVAAPAQKIAVNTESTDSVNEDAASAETTSSRLGMLCKKDVVELKSLAKPPQEVYEVLAAVGFLLGAREKMTWGQCKVMMHDMMFLEKLVSLDVERVSAEALAQTAAIAEMPFFTVEAMRAKSAAAAGLVAWILSVLDEAKKLPLVVEDC
eukprot:TRINITY_DN3130_c0_g1_i2.p1 TRINITY_DN3130_c0_g1~~TRINITY_DN3130_c0_g1_i2.p1  ORF type:complete len:821 (-),score=146.86 TRINITY_DN3130_c0_g1_i2:256-2718(-)